MAVPSGQDKTNQATEPHDLLKRAQSRQEEFCLLCDTKKTTIDISMITIRSFMLVNNPEDFKLFAKSVTYHQEFSDWLDEQYQQLTAWFGVATRDPRVGQQLKDMLEFCKTVYKQAVEANKGFADAVMELFERILETKTTMEEIDDLGNKVLSELVKAGIPQDMVNMLAEAAELRSDDSRVV